MMEHILFMNDLAVAIVEGTEKYRQEILKLKRAEYWGQNRGYGNWDSIKEYESACHWHYHSVERLKQNDNT